jgi:hypothetical protein
MRCTQRALSYLEQLCFLVPNVLRDGHSMNHHQKAKIPPLSENDWHNCVQNSLAVYQTDPLRRICLTLGFPAFMMNLQECASFSCNSVARRRGLRAHLSF